MPSNIAVLKIAAFHCSFGVIHSTKTQEAGSCINDQVSGVYARGVWRGNPIKLLLLSYLSERLMKYEHIPCLENLHFLGRKDRSCSLARHHGLGMECQNAYLKHPALYAIV